MQVLDCRKELAAHLRGRIAKQGIKARVRMLRGTGIQVFPVAYEIEFSETEQRFIRELAVANKLTLVRGLPIDVERMTDPHGMEFYLSRAAINAWTANALRWPNPALRQDRQPVAVSNQAA